MAEGALQTLKVIELAQGISGPCTGKMLAGLGADVLKVEPPDGDWLRRRRPFYQDEPGIEHSGLFMYLNSGKRGVTLDLDQEVGRDLLRDLLKDADVLIEDFQPGTLEAMGLGPEDLWQINPRLVVTRITAFGQTGPHSQYQVGELTAWAAAGYAYLTPAGASSSEEPPLKLGGNQSLFLAGIAASIETMMALIRRERTTGKGQQIDLSIQEAVLVGNDSIWSQYLAWQGLIPTRAAQNGFSYFPCKDGWVSMLFVRDNQWERMVELMDNPPWATTDLFTTGHGRRQNWDVLFPMLSEWLMQYTKQEIVERAQAKRIPLAAVNTAEELANSPHLRDRGFFVSLDREVTGTTEFPGAPFKLSGTPWALSRPAPLLGEHNGEVFQATGRSAEDVQTLFQAEVL